MNQMRGLFMKTAAAVMVAASMLVAQSSIANPININATDWNGKKYNIDSLLNMGKVLVFHQTFSG